MDLPFCWTRGKAISQTLNRGLKFSLTTPDKMIVFSCRQPNVVMIRFPDPELPKHSQKVVVTVGLA
jgi:hypothetical protein